MLPQVDAVLGTAVSAEDVPGVVAMAATEAGVVYEGVFGSRRIHEGPAMTRHTILIIMSAAPISANRTFADCPSKSCNSPAVAARST